MRTLTVVLLGVTALAVTLAACGDATASRFEAAVDTYCERTVNTCADEVDFYDDLAGCHAVWDASYYDSDGACAEASAAYVECIAALECDEYVAWNGGTSGLCAAEETAWIECSPF